MFWVVQNNIFREQNGSVMMKTLRKKKIPHIEVKVVPFFDKIVPAEFDTHGYKGDISEVEDIKIDTDLPIMVMGSTSLNKIAKKNNWQPGSFLNENFHYEEWKKHYGEELLNYESIVDTFEDIETPWEAFFIRPCEDTKDFAGTMYTQKGFEKWREEILEDGNCIFAKSDVVVSPLKLIKSEYRFFVVDGKVVTYSQYKKEGLLYKSQDIKQEVINYAQKIVDKWQPARAFVLDVAETEEGMKIVEINNINSAGFYKCDMVKLIEAIEEMKF